MNLLRAPLVGLAISMLVGSAWASSGSLGGGRPQIMPVVVQTNAQGQVTDINPALQLSPAYKQLLMKQLNAWITNPATWKGHPVASEFIVQVAMRAKPRKDGNYDVSYIFVGSQPMAYAGPWHWNVVNGGREFALVSDVGRWYPQHEQTMQLVRPNTYFDAARAREIASGGAGGVAVSANHAQPVPVARTTSSRTH